MAAEAMHFIGIVTTDQDTVGIRLRCVVGIDHDTGNWSMDFTLPETDHVMRFIVSGQAEQATIWQLVLNSLREQRARDLPRPAR